MGLELHFSVRHCPDRIVSKLARAPCMRSALAGLSDRWPVCDVHYGWWALLMAWPLPACCSSGRGCPVLPGSGQAPVWQHALRLQRFPGHHEGVQVADVSPACYTSAFLASSCTLIDSVWLGWCYDSVFSLCCLLASCTSQYSSFLDEIYVVMFHCTTMSVKSTSFYPDLVWVICTFLSRVCCEWLVLSIPIPLWVIGTFYPHSAVSYWYFLSPFRCEWLVLFIHITLWVISTFYPHSAVSYQYFFLSTFQCEWSVVLFSRVLWDWSVVLFSRVLWDWSIVLFSRVLWDWSVVLFSRVLWDWSIVLFSRVLWDWSMPNSRHEAQSGR